MAKVSELPLTERQIGQLDGFVDGPLPEALAPLDAEVARDALLGGSEEYRQLPYFKESCSFEPLALTPIGELVNEPEEAFDWLAEGLLLGGGTSMWVGPPKAGKTTTIFTVALSVAAGVPLFGRVVRRGRVLLVCLEEKRREVQRQFHRMGAGPQDDVLIFADPRVPEDLPWKVSLAVHEYKPALVVVDPLWKFCRVKDANDYAAVNEAVQPLHDMARASGAHIAVLHHSRKGGGSGGEESLGSTAFTGAFDTILSLKRDDNGQRTIYSLNRYGTDLPETVVSLTENGWIQAAGTKADQSTHAAAVAIMEYLDTQFEPVGILEIVEAVGMKRATVTATLNAMTDGGKLTRTGAGGRASRYLYWKPDPE